MNKKNNDGKTFDDIFSAILNNDDSQNSSKEESVNEELNGSIGSDKTFNSIFSKVNSVEEKSDNNSDKKSFSDIFSSNENEVSTKEDKDNQFFEESKENIKGEESKSFSDIFSNNVKESSNEEKVEEVKKEENPFFDNVKEEIKEDVEKEKSFSDIFSNNVKESSNEDKVEEDKKEENPFFDTVKDEIKEDVEEEKSFSDIFSNNVEESSNEDKVEEDKKEENPFFDNVREETKEESSFFSDNESNANDSSVNDNIFFDEESGDELREEESKVDSNVESNKDVSPFFEDTVVEDNNPFFNNTINLIEDSTASKRDVSGKIDTTNVQNFDVKIRKKKPNLIQAIIGILSYALFIWLLLVGIALLVYVLDIKIRAAKGDTSPPKYGAYVVLTGSMLPEIQVYDVVVTKKQDAKDLKEGDVITFASSDSRFAGTIITHRIIKKNYSSKTKSYTFQTKGDNNNVADSALVTPSNIYGKVILKIPKLGYLRDFLASDGGWILVILFPCLAVVAYDVVKISKGLSKKKYKNIKVQSR